MSHMSFRKTHAWSPCHRSVASCSNRTLFVCFYMRLRRVLSCFVSAISCSGVSRVPSLFQFSCLRGLCQLFRSLWSMSAVSCSVVVHPSVLYVVCTCFHTSLGYASMLRVLEVFVLNYKYCICLFLERLSHETRLCLHASCSRSVYVKL